jgi:EAL domain-containing protein (putative c-di-GMP-specific phosphodiesterase class I)/CheY-like chemotaxis protein
MLCGTRIAIFHDDSEIAANIAKLAGEADLVVVQPASSADLEAELSDPLVAAVVIDLMGPRTGGFELLERVANAPARPQVIVVTALDTKTIDSLQRFGRMKELNLRVFRKDDDANLLRSCLTDLGKREARFTAAHLEDAIERQLIHVEYQPKVPLVTNDEEYAVEALCRLRHPHFGNVYPEQFIAIAEKHGLIDKITDSVVCHAFRDLGVWRDQGFVVRLALNISPVLLKTDEWCEQFMRRCQEFEIEPHRITLEITESSSGATLDVAFDVLTRLRQKGFLLSIDDFGTGFSSLATLYKLPFNELKIDKSFTFDFQKSAEARALIESTIGMAQRLGLKVVAEGVETEAVFRELRLMGCQDAQGYFVSKSLPSEQVPRFFADWASLMKSDPIREENALPKIAIIQALLSDILTDNSVDDAALVLTDLGNAGVLDENSTLRLARKIPALVLQGQVAGALARCQAALQRLEREPHRVALKGKILQLRQLLEQELVCKDDLTLFTADGPVRLLASRTALIGRPSTAKAVDIPVGCRWFSRGEKSLRLSVQGEEWFVEDLGSTNGSWIGDVPLQSDHPYKLPYGETLIEIGKRAGSTAPVAIRLRRPPNCSSAIVMTLLADYARMNDASEENQWPSWREDLRVTWVVFDGRISLGASKNCAVVLSDCGVDVAADIRFHDGFWITPSSDVPLSIAEVPFTEETPLVAGADLFIGNARLRVETLQPAMPPAPANYASARAKSR